MKSLKCERKSTKNRLILICSLFWRFLVCYTYSLGTSSVEHRAGIFEYLCAWLMLFSVLQLESSTCTLCYVQFVILWSVLLFHGLLIGLLVFWFLIVHISSTFVICFITSLSLCNLCNFCTLPVFSESRCLHVPVVWQSGGRCHDGWRPCTLHQSFVPSKLCCWGCASWEGQQDHHYYQEKDSTGRRGIYY